MKHLTRVLATSLAALAVTAGAMSVSAPAHADSSWGWGPAGRTAVSGR